MNNAAIVAKYALDKHKNSVKKVLIFDWDVHHGDGTQNALYDNPNVLFISLHLFNKACFYPNSPNGNFTRIGKGDAAGFNINIPWNKLSKEEEANKKSNDYSKKKENMKENKDDDSDEFSILKYLRPGT